MATDRQPNDCASDGAWCWFKDCKQSGCKYQRGCMRPNYPVPAPLWLSDTAIGWSLLRCDCAICAENYNDQLWDDVYIATS